MSLGDFEIQKKGLQEQIAAAETEAQFTMDMSEVEILNKQLEVLEANKLAYEDKVGQVEAPASENQVKQITELGGTEEELVKREEVQDEKVEEVKEVLEDKAEGVVESETVESLREEYSKLGEKIMEFPRSIISSMSSEEKHAFVSQNPNEANYLNTFLNDMSQYKAENGSFNFENANKYVNFISKFRGEDYSSQKMNFSEVEAIRKQQEEIGNKINQKLK